MTKEASLRKIKTIVEKYKESATAYYAALDDDNFTKQKFEMDSVNKIVEMLDSFGVEGRLALIALLDDANQGIRVLAAAFLLKEIPDRAIAVLKEIQVGQTIYPRLTAVGFLRSYAEGKMGQVIFFRAASKSLRENDLDAKGRITSNNPGSFCHDHAVEWGVRPVAYNGLSITNRMDPI
ncbi:hypothetical protein [Rhodoblastus sp.]|uniref:hypothetical protein n=1 Tax=Rhodoblastus sp. TaxID=1962975 RepID=UPI003FD77A97